MTNTLKSSRTLHTVLWIAQILLAATLLSGGLMKLILPIEKLAAMWPWAGEVAPAFVLLTGVIDLLGAIGLILPAMLRIKPALTPFTAIFVLALMIAASIFHISRGEASDIGFNLFCAALAIFIAWGRFKKAPVEAK